MSYDVYYSTGGGSLIMGGSDVWVNYWLQNIAPKLKRPSKLLIHRAPNSIVEFDSPIEVVWQNEPEVFKKVLGEAERIHILHGYYHPKKEIMDNLDKIYSNILHVTVEKSLRAGVYLGLKKLKHFAANISYEKEILKASKNNIWIGVDDTTYHKDNDIIDIPNFYEFKRKKDVVMNDRVGFLARMETRKAPHFINDIDSCMLTDISDVQWWRDNLEFQWNKTKVFQFQYKNLQKFLERDDWGISHSAHVYEPFGYSIFEAIDYGKLPILAADWLFGKLEYPFRAANKQEFENTHSQICKLSEKERQYWLLKLRAYLSRYDNKDEWINKYLEIYNS